MSEELSNQEAATVAPVAEQPTVYNSPRYTVKENEAAYDLRVDIPGAKKETVSVSVEDEILTIEAKRNVGKGEGWTPIHREIEKNPYKLQLKLNSEVNINEINASFAEGVLTIKIPKAAKAKARVISVE